jgi:hypothetical protein
VCFRQPCVKAGNGHRKARHFDHDRRGCARASSKYVGRSGTLGPVWRLARVGGRGGQLRLPAVS